MAGKPGRSGRKSEYDEVTARRLCETIATGRSLADVCREPWAPNRATVNRWEHANPDFAAAIYDARTVACDELADQCISISDEPVKDSAAASRQRMRIEARHWMISKVRPKQYGDQIRVDMNVKGDPREAERRATEALALADTRLAKFTRLEMVRSIAANLPEGPAREEIYRLHPESRPYVPAIESTARRIPNTNQEANP